MLRHSWRTWRRGMERCARRGCKALRVRRRYSRDGAQTWSVLRPECTGEPTTDR